MCTESQEGNSFFLLMGLYKTKNKSVDVLQVQLMLSELRFLIFKIESRCVAVMVDFPLAIKNPCDSNNKNSFTQRLQLNSFPFKPNPRS